MSSYILHFRPWAVAFLVLFVLEITVAKLLRPNPLDRTNFLEFSFVKPETPQRLFVYHKIKEFADSSPTIVQSGDSSGFYGIDPRVVMHHLPKGATYLNMSCCANLGFRGYYNLFRFIAERNPSLRYFVLHFTPYTMPRPETWDGDGAALWGTPEITVFGDVVHQEFISPTRKLLHLPSMGFRREVTDYAYYLNGRFNDPDRPLLNNVNYLEFLKLFQETRGWMPETDVRVNVPMTECDMPMPTFFKVSRLARKTYLEEVLESFATLASEYNATLVVVFQPVACTVGSGEKNREARAAIERFKKKHPEVEIPFPLIESWPSDKFSVPAHVKSEHTDLIGNRLGKAMAEIVSRRGL